MPKYTISNLDNLYSNRYQSPDSIISAVNMDFIPDGAKKELSAFKRTNDGQELEIKTFIINGDVGENAIIDVRDWATIHITGSVKAGARIGGGYGGINLIIDGDLEKGVTIDRSKYVFVNGTIYDECNIKSHALYANDVKDSVKIECFGDIECENIGNQVEIKNFSSVSSSIYCKNIGEDCWIEEKNEGSIDISGDAGARSVVKCNTGNIKIESADSSVAASSNGKVDIHKTTGNKTFFDRHATPSLVAARWMINNYFFNSTNKPNPSMQQEVLSAEKEGIKKSL